MRAKTELWLRRQAGSRFPRGSSTNEQTEYIMKTIKTLAIGLAVVAAISVTSVRASIVAIDGPAGDWSQEFIENGVGNFTAMEVAWVSGSLLQTPVFADFTVVGWSQVAGGSLAALASGPATTSMLFSLNFVGSTAPTVFYFWAFDGTRVVDTAKAGWDSQGGWSFPPTLVPPAAVPEPTTMVAGALLLLPFGASTLRILRRRTA